MSNEPVFLYVEDDALSREVMELLLATMGFYQFTILPDSTDFPAIIQEISPIPDVIFLDIHVKPYSGFEMLEMIRQDPTYDNTIVVALTASVMNEEVQRLKTAGFNGVVAKPLDQDTFPTTLDRLLQGEEVWRIVG